VMKRLKGGRRASSASQSYGGFQLFSGIRLLHNLVHALAAEVKRIGNLAERHSLVAHLNDFAIARMVRRRARLQRAPLPAVDLLQARHSVRREEALLVSLTHVADPRADGDLFFTHEFHMESGAAGVALTRSELLKSLNVQVESGVVVHDQEFRTSLHPMRERTNFLSSCHPFRKVLRWWKGDHK